MQNLDPLLALQPIVVIAVTAALIIYWRARKRFPVSILPYTLFAYFGAIAIKYVIQTLTITQVFATGNLYVEGIYYGLQTSLLEVGLAYLVARYAISKKDLKARDASGYGLGLAFWEDGVLLGVFSLIGIIGTYAVLSGNGAVAIKAYDSLASSAPSYFLPPASLLPKLALGILERISSILVHVAWGYLAFLAAFYKRRDLLAVALPMGFVDFFVPFASAIGIAYFELLIFAIAVASVLVAWHITRHMANRSRKS